MADRPTPDWRYLFNTEHMLHGWIHSAARRAAACGYPYMFFNKRVYKVSNQDGKLELVGVTGWYLVEDGRVSRWTFDPNIGSKSFGCPVVEYEEPT